MSFSVGIDAYAKKTKLGIDKAVISINSQAAASIIEKTPVDKGTARGNWYATISSPSSDYDESRRSVESNTNAIETSSKSAGTLFFLTNNLPYIRRLEYGYSKKAPSGMVRTTLEKIKSIIKKEFRVS